MVICCHAFHKGLDMENKTFDDYLRESVEMGVAKYLFPIATKKGDSYEIQGTCIAISDGDHHFLVTAAHVTYCRHNAPNLEIYICNWAGDEFIRIEEDIVGFESPGEIPSEFDISVIKIERERYRTIPEENFLYENGIYVDQGESFEHVFALSGFPVSKNNSFPKYKTSPKIFFYAVGAARKESLVDIFLLELPFDHPDAPKPSGMSGGGLWIFTKDLPRNPSLAGILVSWIPDEKKIVSVKMDLVIALIKGFFPGSRFDDFPTFNTVIETENNALLCIPVAPSDSGE